MDVHRGLDGVSPEDAAEVHQRDISIQDQFGIRFLSGSTNTTRKRSAWSGRPTKTLWWRATSGRTA
jgi:hypothetical protein